MNTVLLNDSTVEEYNIALYDIQSLAYGSHNVIVTLLTWPTGGPTQAWFDYAVVNEVQPAYYIDDRNTSISYTPAASWHQDPDGGAVDETL